MSKAPGGSTQTRFPNAPAKPNPQMPGIFGVMQDHAGMGAMQRSINSGATAQNPMLLNPMLAWASEQKGGQGFNGPPQPPQPTPGSSFSSTPFGQRLHNISDWWSLMRRQNPNDYFASMYKAQQPVPAPSPTTTPQSSANSMYQGYNPNTGMPI